MKTLTSAFATEKDKTTGAAPVWILKCPFATGTVYLSDMVFTVDSWDGGITTKSWIKEWGQVDEDISGDMSLAKVSDFSVQVLIDPDSSPNMAGIIASTSNDVETTVIELYLWFQGLDASSDPPVLMWTGNIIDYSYCDELTYRLDLVDQGVNIDKYVGLVLNASDYPMMDPADEGKIAPIVIGSVKKVPLPCVVAGGASSLTEDIDSNDTYISVDDISSFTTGSCLVQIGDEIMTATVGTSGITASVRGASNTTAVPHSAGDKVIEYRSTGYKYIAGDGERAISFGNVYVDGELMPSGEYEANNTSPPYVILTHGPVDKSPSESLAPFGLTASGWKNAVNVTDGDEETYAESTTGATGSLIVTFARSTKKATVVRQEVEVILSVESGIILSFSGWTVDGASTLTGTGGIVTKVFKKSGGTRASTLAFTTPSKGVQAFIYEVGPKNIFTYRVNQGGDTAAKVLVGSVVTADISTSSATQRPDTAIKSLLTTYAGWDEDNFVTDADTLFESKGYLFSNLLINERRKLRDWLTTMAFQCRCYFRFARGKAYLIYRPDSHTSQKSIANAMIRMGDDYKTTLKAGRTSLSEVINLIRVKYDRDWSGGGYKSIDTVSAGASIIRYGEKERTDLFTFDFVKLKAMAEDLRDFYLAEYKDRRRVFTVEVFLDNMEIEFADTVTLASGGYVCEVSKVNVMPGSGRDGRNDKIELVLRQCGTTVPDISYPV